MSKVLLETEDANNGEFTVRLNSILQLKLMKLITLALIFITGCNVDNRKYHITRKLKAKTLVGDFIVYRHGRHGGGFSSYWYTMEDDSKIVLPNNALLIELSRCSCEY